MNSTIKHMQLNLNNETKQAQRKAEEQRAYENLQQATKQLKEIKREQDT